MIPVQRGVRGGFVDDPVITVGGEDEAEQQHIYHNTDSSLRNQGQVCEVFILVAKVAKQVQYALHQKEHTTAEGSGTGKFPVDAADAGKLQEIEQYR